LSEAAVAYERADYVEAIRLYRLAADQGHAAAQYNLRTIIEAKHHPEQGMRPSLGIIRLARQYGAERLEAASLRALHCVLRSYGSIRSILENNLDQRPLRQADAETPPLGSHVNVRGSTYYH
jgi:hypothetical protein